MKKIFVLLVCLFALSSAALAQKPLAVSNVTIVPEDESCKTFCGVLLVQKVAGMQIYRDGKPVDFKPGKKVDVFKYTAIPVGGEWQLVKFKENKGVIKFYLPAGIFSVTMQKYYDAGLPILGEWWKVEPEYSSKEGKVTYRYNGKDYEFSVI